MDLIADIGEQIAQLLSGPPGMVWELYQHPGVLEPGVPLQASNGAVVGYACPAVDDLCALVGSGDPE